MQSSSVRIGNMVHEGGRNRDVDGKSQLNEEMLQMVLENRSTIGLILIRQIKWSGHIMRLTPNNYIVEGRMGEQ